VEKISSSLSGKRSDFSGTAVSGRFFWSTFWLNADALDAWGVGSSNNSKKIKKNLLIAFIIAIYVISGKPRLVLNDTEFRNYAAGLRLLI
jgi:hypothetical protein